MKDFLVKLYESPNFALYLGVAIVVLLIAFFIIFFMGRKDQAKLEKTKKLDIIDDNTFKEITPPVNMEVPLNDEQAVSKKEDEPVLDEVPITPKEDIYTANRYENITTAIDNDLTEMESYLNNPILNEKVEPPISLPKVENPEGETKKNSESETNNASIINDVFSSVYVPPKDPVLFDDDDEIELPRLK